MVLPAITFAVGAPLVLWLLYRRVRRNFGPQPLSAARLWPRALVLAAVAALLLLSGLLGNHWGVDRLDRVAGLAGGVALGILGLRLTRFHAGADGRCYVPDSTIGVALTLVLLGRLAYRFIVLGPDASQAAVLGQDAATADAWQRSPLTMVLAGLLVGYYLTYYIGLLRRAHRGPALQATGPVP